jgi:hypothetical protein
MSKTKRSLLIIVLTITFVLTATITGFVVYLIQNKFTGSSNQVGNSVTSNSPQPSDSKDNSGDNSGNSSENQNLRDSPSLKIENNNWEISTKLYDVESSLDTIETEIDPQPSFLPIEIEFTSEQDILFIADEQIFLADLSNQFLKELVEEGAALSSDPSALYDFSKQNFSATNLESFGYDDKMTQSTKQNPLRLSQLAKAKAGYCIEQSIFRSLSYAYANNPHKIVVMYPSLDNHQDFGHATVKQLSASPIDVIQNFLDTGLYTWEVRYFQEIIIERK